MSKKEIIKKDFNIYISYLRNIDILKILNINKNNKKG
jgi:hypothetical protein